MKFLIGALKILQLDFRIAAEVIGLGFFGVGLLGHLGILAADRVFFLSQIADRRHAQGDIIIRCFFQGLTKMIAGGIVFARRQLFLSVLNLLNCSFLGP